MSQVQADLLYTKEHEWAKVSGNTATIGITDYAQHELGDIVFVDLPQVGKVVKQGDSFGEIEAVKTVAALYAPLSGKIVEVNSALAEAADGINKDPYGNGWIVKIELSNASETSGLLNADAYKGLI
ncbi:MAG: glycine cleavage system protein GcvH [Fibrobacteres bacterium]|nr:glycine cleavage system protein GcvH [Fibrobacterota bacterium]